MSSQKRVKISFSGKFVHFPFKFLLSDKLTLTEVICTRHYTRPFPTVLNMSFLLPACLSLCWTPGFDRCLAAHIKEEGGLLFMKKRERGGAVTLQREEEEEEERRERGS